MQTAHKGGIGSYRHLQRTFKLLRSSHSVCRQARGLLETVAVLLLTVCSPEATLLPACRSQATGTPEYGTLPAMDTPMRARKPVRPSSSCRGHLCSTPATQLFQQTSIRMRCPSRRSWLQHCHTRHAVAAVSATQHTCSLPGTKPWLLARLQVVTAIIRRDSDGKLLLVKRSDQVMHTHPQR
jgi:hypothetical protein